jgi:hypothetical protein
MLHQCSLVGNHNLMLCTISGRVRCYFVARSITCLHGVILSVYHAFAFDAAKKEMDAKSSNKANGHTPGFDRIPGTAFSAWISFFPSILVACVGLTKLLWAVDCGKLSDWGQSAAVVTTLAGGMHWLYAFVCDIIHTSQRHNESLTRRPTVVLHDLFESAKNQYLDYGRLDERSFPHALDAKGILELQQDILISISIGDRIGFKEAIKAIVRRQKQGEHISFDFVNDKNETPFLLALAHGLSPYAEELIISSASIAVPTTMPAISAAAKTCDMTVMQRILDLGTCDVNSIIAALTIFDTNYTGTHVTTFMALSRYMIQYVENRSTTSDEGVSSRLVELAQHCKDGYLCELVLTSRLLDRAFPCDGERFTLLQAASAYNVTWKLAELNVANLPNAERRSALLVALRHGSLEAAKLILNLYDKQSRYISLPQKDLKCDHPLDLLTCALSIGDQFLEKVLDLGVADSVASTTSYHNDEDINQKASSAVKHDSMVKLFDAPVNATTASRELLSLISTTAILEGHYESVNGLSSSDFEPSERQVRIFRLTRYMWTLCCWPPMLRRLGIEINNHWAASVNSRLKFNRRGLLGMANGGVDEEVFEILDIRQFSRLPNGSCQREGRRWSSSRHRAGQSLPTLQERRDRHAHLGHSLLVRACTIRFTSHTITKSSSRVVSTVPIRTPM